MGAHFSKENMRIIEGTTDFHEDRALPGKLILDHRQEIPDDFVSLLKQTKIDADHQRMGEFLHAASVPSDVHELWLREGYDCTQEPIRETIKRLRAAHLDAFIVTNKRI